MTDFKDKSVLVLGLGETGISIVRWLAGQGAVLRVADSRDAPPGLDEVSKYVAQERIHCGEFCDALFDSVELIAISPGVPLSEPHVARAAARGIQIVGDIELFARHIGNSRSDIYDPRVIAITGSNGKTTVTSMVEHMCKAAGKDAVAAGNISPAVLDDVMQRNGNQPDVWVLELSSFQLETTSSLNADAATVLNVSEDHLDRYDGMDGYAAAKQRIFQGGGVQVINRDDARCRNMRIENRNSICFGLNLPEREQDFGIARVGMDVWLMQGSVRLMKASELKVAGLHNVANALAALALCRAIDLPMPALIGALKSFKGLPHRVELVGTLHDIAFYDDSKGTNVGATVAALEGLGCRAVLIAGGIGKDQDFSPLKPAVAKHARAIVLIGRDAPLIESAIDGCQVPVSHAADMQDAVLKSAALAKPGDAVLLSPACASFDMFRNYAHRAEVFVAEVKKLAEEGSWPH